MRYLAVLAMVVMFAACGEDEPRPVPCAARQQCPEGLTCIADECVTPRLDGHCEIGDSDVCPLVDTVCFVGDDRLGTGACELPCDSNADCFTLDTRRCLVLPTATAASGACVLPCDGAKACPASTECRMLPDQTSVCLPIGLPTLGGECVHDASCQVLTPGSLCALDASGIVYVCRLP